MIDIEEKHKIISVNECEKRQKKKHLKEMLTDMEDKLSNTGQLVCLTEITTDGIKNSL